MRVEQKKKLTAKDLKAAGLSENTVVRRVPRQPRNRRESVKEEK